MVLIALQGDTRSVAWTDFNGDFFPDFAAGVYGGQTRLYLNTQNNTFVLHSALPAVYNTTSIAWADWDGDGLTDILVNSTNANWLRNEGERDGVYHFTNQNLR